MLNSTYILKHYLNINYLKKVNRGDKDVIESVPTTYEIALVVFSKIGGHISFSALSKVIEDELDPYQMTQINDVPPFDTMEPTIQNIAYFLKSTLEEKIEAFDCRLLSIEIGETPLNFYIYNNLTDEEFSKHKMYLNIFHSIWQDGKWGLKHEHSLEINCVLCGKFDVEKHVTPIIEPYQGAYMNEIDEFRNANPTLENISEFFRDKIEMKLEEKKLLFHSIEIAEKSTISYIC